MEAGGGGGVFGSRHRFTGEEFYRRHFVALRFHAVNVAASFCQTDVSLCVYVCVWIPRNAYFTWRTTEIRVDAEMRRCIDAKCSHFPKASCGFRDITSSLFLVSTRLSTDEFVIQPMTKYFISGERISSGEKFFL